MKQKLLISFSGGETSAYMTQWLIANKRDRYEMIVVFANTGEENEETLEFVEECDKYFRLNVVWVEGVYDPTYGIGPRHKIVDYHSASRKGEPFRAMVSKYGIPNIGGNFCSKNLKAYVIRSYARSIGWKKYYTAIGIRSDEFDRISTSREKERLVYPLISDHSMTKPQINAFWRRQYFRLNLCGYQGNCKTCWKKSTRKLLTIAKESPESFATFADLEREYGHYIPETKRGNKNIKLPIRFFRNSLSVADLFEMSKQPFTPAADDSIVYPDGELDGIELDLSNGCIESCEVF